MPSLKQYRDQISSVKSTKKITQAMKMVAAAKLRKAQEKAERSHPYAAGMASILSRLGASMAHNIDGPKLLTGTGASDKHLMILCSSDRGLCGGFNTNLIRYIRDHIQTLKQHNKELKLIIIGRKGRDAMHREFRDHIIKMHESGEYDFQTADNITKTIIARFDEGAFDIVTLYYNEFHSIISQKPTTLQLVPFQLPKPDASVQQINDVIDFEPDEATILNEILPRNIAVQIYGAMLDSAAGEQAARMTAMDNATRNAGELINKHTLAYNRARQAHITKELIEIISGAEAV